MSIPAAVTAVEYMWNHPNTLRAREAAGNAVKDATEGMRDVASEIREEMSEAAAKVRDFFNGSPDATVYQSERGLGDRLGAGVGLAIQGITKAFDGDNIQLRELNVVSANWPADAPPLKIALLADTHVGSPFMGLEDLRQVVDRTNALKPDIVLLAGDFSNQEEHVARGTASKYNGVVVKEEPIARELARLEAPGGVVAVLGNHDNYDAGISGSLLRHLRDNGITVLENDAIQVEAGGQKFWVGGLADEWTRTPNMTRIQDKVGDDPYLLMAHNPDTFQRMPEGAGIQVAGHTHGGQVGVPFVKKLLDNPWISKLLEDRENGLGKWLGEYVDNPYGHTTTATGQDRYVTSGLGTSGVPLRVGMPGEIAVITLTGADESQTAQRPDPAPSAPRMR